MSLSSLATSAGMSRRHLLKHLAASATLIPGLQFLQNIEANAAALKKNNKSCILLWMSGGPPTIDI